MTFQIFGALVAGMLGRVGEHTVPFGLVWQSVAVAWYALNADPAADVARRRRIAPWYSQKRAPPMLDILAALRRELIRAEFPSTSRLAVHRARNQAGRPTAQPAAA